MTAHRLLAAAAGFAADRVLGEPAGVPHPVSAFGTTMQRIERFTYRPSRLCGIGYTAAGILLGATAGLAIRSTATATYVAVAGRALGDAAAAVDGALHAGDQPLARKLIPALVGRDPTDLDEGEICRAVIESVAENTVDAVVAPMIWSAFGGGPAVLGYRAANTMDAMVGHRSDRYLQFGWSAARLDDVLNWIPARFTAALVAAARPRRAGAVWRAVRRDAPGHPSPNAGVAEAAFAAALGLRLGGENRYGERVELRPPLGDGRLPERSDIVDAIRLSRDTGLLFAGLLAATGVAGLARSRSMR